MNRDIPYYLIDNKPYIPPSSVGAKRIDKIYYDFTFIDDKGYDYYFKYLTLFMKSKYKYMDLTEIIHGSILRSCQYSYTFDSKKSSKNTWMCKISINEIRQYFKIKNRKNTISIDKPIEYNGNIIDIKNIISNDEYNDSFPINYNEIIFLVKNDNRFNLIKYIAFDKKSYKDIQAIENININTLKTRIRKQRMKLKKIIMYEINNF